MRVGCDYSYSNVDTNSASFTIHYWWYVQTQYNYSGDVQALNFSGWYGGATGYTLNSGHGGVTLVSENDATYNYGGWGGSPGNIDVCAQVSGAYNGSTPTLCLSLWIPGRPYAPPLEPFPRSATRDNDSEITVNWTRTDTAQRPWDFVQVALNRYGTNGWQAMGIVASIPGQPASAHFTNLPTNYIYDYIVLSGNSVGNSGWFSVGWVWTRPDPPSNVSAVLGPTGTTIPITWVNHHYSDGSQTLTIERSVGGGGWAQVATGLSWGTAAWEDPTPGAGTNKYRVKVTSAGLDSTWAESNVVSTVVPPLAPTALAPDGIAVDTFGLGAVLTWTHNPGGDFAAQSHYTIEKSSDGGANWTALAAATNVASAVSSHTVAPGVLANGGTWMWKVKTQGGTTAAFGPFSDPATINAETTPTLSFAAGQPSNPTLALPVRVGWVYAQAQAVAQTAWEASLFAADAVTLLEHQGGTGATALVSFAYPVTDGVTYWVAVRAMSGSGLWSIWITTDTTIDLPPPAPTTLVPTYQPCTGTMSLAITSADPGPGEAVVESVVVERRVAGGDWVVLARDVPPVTTMLDLIPLTNGLNEYRATGVSSTPSTLVNPVVQVQGTDGQNLGPGRDGLWVFLNYGDGFATVLRVHNDLDIQDSPSRTQRLQGFLGRRKPTLLSGTGISRQVSVGASLFYQDPCPDPDTCRFDSPPVDWITAGEDAAVVCYRDFTGRRLFASLDGVQVSDGVWPGHAALGFKATEADYIEVTGALIPQRYLPVTDSAGSTDTFVLQMNNAKLLPSDSAGSTDSVVYEHGPGAGSGVGQRLYVDPAGSTDPAMVDESKTQVDSAGSTDSATVVKTP